MILLLEDCLDVTFHGEEECALLIVPVKVDAGIFLSFPVSGDGVVLFQRGEEVFGVAFLHT